jgi:hypothetical protein
MRFKSPSEQRKKFFVAFRALTDRPTEFGGGSADRTEIDRCVLRHSIVFPHCQFFS